MNTGLALDWLLLLLVGLAVILVFLVVLGECLRRNIVVEALSGGTKVDLDCVDGVEELKLSVYVKTKKEETKAPDVEHSQMSCRCSQGGRIRRG